MDPLIAYIIADATGWKIVPSSNRRDWMDATPGKGAYRCLPLVVANQAGWVIPAPTDIHATWNGTIALDAIKVETPNMPSFNHALSHFGNGILTFRFPYLFRTPPNVGLLVRSAPNFPLEDTWPLEGYVETDWNPGTFTMNWKLMKPNVTVVFPEGFPLCFIQPYRVDLLEQLQPQMLQVDASPQEKADLREWSDSRKNFLENLAENKGGWQKDYFSGRTMRGDPVPSHRKSLKLKTFSPEMKDEQDAGDE